MTINMGVFDAFPILESERLLLRRLVPEDVKPFLKVYGNPKVAEWDWFEPLSSEEMALRYISGFNRDFDNAEEIVWAIVLKETQMLIGTCSLGDFDDKVGLSEIGYCLAEEEWNKGYMTEAIQAVLGFGFYMMNLNRIEAMVTPGNDSSIRVLEKAGFSYEGLLKERDYLKGKVVSSVVMAILRREYVSVPK